MIRHLSLDDLRSLLRNGAGATVSASQFQADDFKSLARNLTGNAVLHITNSAALQAEDMKSIARNATGPAYVMFSGQP